MATTIEVRQDNYRAQHDTFEVDLRDALARIRGIDLSTFDLGGAKPTTSIPALLSRYTTVLKDAHKQEEGEALDQAREKTVDRKAFGGLGLNDNAVATSSEQAETLFLVEAWLEAINSREKAKDFLSYQSSATAGTRPMTLAEKIFAQHVVGEKPEHGLAAGDVVRVGVDWILASELSWGVCISLSYYTALFCERSYTDSVTGNGKDV